MLNSIKKYAGVVGASGALLGLTASQAHAVVDISAITAAGTDIAAVGLAVFVVTVGIFVFKWVRRAL